MFQRANKELKSKVDVIHTELDDKQVNAPYYAPYSMADDVVFLGHHLYLLMPICDFHSALYLHLKMEPMIHLVKNVSRYVEISTDMCYVC